MIKQAWGLLTLVPLVAEAHHSTAGYDFDAVEEVQGEIVRVSWVNPHVRLTIRPSDGTEEWELEAQDINSLGRRGLSQELLVVGDVVRVAGNPARRSERQLFVTNILLPSGTEIRTRGETTSPRWSEKTLGFGEVNLQGVQSAADQETGLFRVWMVSEPKFYAMSEFPLTPSARAAREASNPADSLVERCIASGMPSAMTMGAPHPVDFAQKGRTIVIRSEWFDVVRTVHMDGERGQVSESPSPLGYSVGRWDGKTLVVETSRIDWPYLDRAGSIPQSSQVETVERFDVDDLNDRLNYTLTIADPETLTAPVSMEWVLDWRPDLVVEPYECRAE